MYQQYYKSDFELIMKRYTYDPKATDEAEKLTPVPWPEDIDWRLKLATPHSAKPYEASCRGGVTKNCTKTEDGGILVALDNHGLACGELRYEFLFELPDPAMASGIADKYRAGSTGIMLTADATCDCGGLVDVAVLADMYKGDKGDKGEPFRYSDFTPEQLEDLRRPAQEAADGATEAVSALEKAVSDAEDLRVKAEDARDRAEQERNRAEDERISVEADRQKAETARQAAEDARATAETARADAEKLRAQAETLRINAENNRANAETEREKALSDIIAQAQSALKATNEAIAAADKATQLANDAAELCATKIAQFEAIGKEILSHKYLTLEN